jgi:transposase-like protein
MQPKELLRNLIYLKTGLWVKILYCLLMQNTQRVRINGSVVDVANWLEKNVEDSLTYFDFYEFWWSKIRTSNCIERLNREIKRRTQIIGVFPNIESYRTSHRSYPYGKK